MRTGETTGSDIPANAMRIVTLEAKFANLTTNINDVKAIVTRLYER